MILKKDDKGQLIAEQQDGQIFGNQPFTRIMQVNELRQPPFESLAFPTTGLAPKHNQHKIELYIHFLN